MSTTTDFKEFMDEVETDNYDELHSLKMAVEDEDNCGPFEVQKRDDNDKLIISICTSDLKLLLASNKAKKYFLEFIESEFGGELGIEGEYEFKRQMEKD